MTLTVEQLHQSKIQFYRLGFGYKVQNKHMDKKVYYTRLSDTEFYKKLERLESSNSSEDDEYTSFLRSNKYQILSDKKHEKFNQKLMELGIRYDVDKEVFVDMKTGEVVVRDDDRLRALLNEIERNKTSYESDLRRLTSK
jgi:flagellar basal body P-ring protein FlgI